MKKLNETIYRKLYAQGEEAKSKGMTKLASDIFEAIGPHANEEKSEYSYTQLQEDIHRDLWKVATRLLHYHDLKSVDAQKLDEEIAHWASALTDGLEHSLKVESVVGPLEPKLPGQTE
jgi:hypothetical protein